MSRFAFVAPLLAAAFAFDSPAESGPSTWTPALAVADRAVAADPAAPG